MRNKVSNVLWGAAFILGGVAIAGNVLELWNFSLFFDGWWTLFIIIPSLISIFQNGPRTTPLVFLAVGIMFLLSAQGLFDWGLLMKLLVPIILVIIGLQLLFRGAFERKATVPPHEAGKIPEYSAIFSGNEVNYGCEEFYGASLTGVFGGVNLNLKSAIITQDVVINAVAVFGGCDILVPPNVKVKVSSVPIFGGTSNKVPPVAVADAPTVYVNATCLFGGVDIK